MREADPNMGGSKNEQNTKMELQSWSGAQKAAHNFVVTHGGGTPRYGCKAPHLRALYQAQAPSDPTNRMGYFHVLNNMDNLTLV